MMRNGIRKSQSSSTSHQWLQQSGFSSLELMVTLSVVATLSLVIVPSLSKRLDQSSVQVTQSTMQTVRDAIMNHYRSDMFETLPYPVDTNRIQHPQLKYLYHNPLAYAATVPNSAEANAEWSYDPTTKRGWSGPYLDRSVPYTNSVSQGFNNRYAEQEDPMPADGWARPIVLQQPVMNSSVYSAQSILYARLVSAGDDGILQTPPDVAEPTAAQTGDDIIVYLRSR